MNENYVDKCEFYAKTNSFTFLKEITIIGFKLCSIQSLDFDQDVDNNFLKNKWSPRRIVVYTLY